MAGSPLQSSLQLPTTIPDNPKFVFSSQGGRRFCGLDQSPVSLVIPQGFTSEGGAEVHCDPNPRPDYQDIQELNQRLFKDAWQNRGYLIGFYPSAKLIKPIQVVFEIDSLRLNKICPTCASIKAYNPTNKKWVALPTSIDRARSRVNAQISSISPSSEYPAFSDRLLVALFIK
jgi:hypothetical protein